MVEKGCTSIRAVKGKNIHEHNVIVNMADGRKQKIKTTVTFIVQKKNIRKKRSAPKAKVGRSRGRPRKIISPVVN